MSLAKVLPDALIDVADAATAITGLTLDSRTVLPGDLYAALPGHQTHGARFAGMAVAAGAVAILTDVAGAALCAGAGVPVVVIERPREQLGEIAARVYGDPAAGLQLLGITGTNGKTTVAAMVESGLRAAGRITGIIGTMGVQVAGVHHPGSRTTPEAPDLHAILGVMRDAGVDSVVMEVSSIAIEERRVDGVRYDVAAFTNLTQDHLDYHQTMESYFGSKARLFTPERADVAIIGIDDAWGERLAQTVEIPRQTWSLLGAHADWHVARDDGQVAVVAPDGQRQPIDVPMAGAFNVANALCAYAVLRTAGVSDADAAAGIAQTSVPGRMQIVGDIAGVRGIVDYAHSPDAIERVLRTARDEATGRVIVVLGAGGDRDRTKRPLMGRLAARLADVFVITDDNPRSEDPAGIRAAVGEGALLVAPGERAEVHEVADRGVAITVAVGLAEAGDMVLVLGKGHEQGQEVAGVVSPFDDASTLRVALEGRLAR
ncbi:MAG: UDP-N-acetylmuramoyl-L-alanyl-D-glutamate--2,6-diaminopimelate ligase [Actinobacteria bacterium]|nr:UDP-N-acetylmuramoyl-L-alanyl-D-glutamate--2,6-diaminopimelate ligase [Actinomycetota bacterium]